MFVKLCVGMRNEKVLGDIKVALIYLFPFFNSSQGNTVPGEKVQKHSRHCLDGMPKRNGKRRRIVFLMMILKTKTNKIEKAGKRTVTTHKKKVGAGRGRQESGGASECISRVKEGERERET